MNGIHHGQNLHRDCGGDVFLVFTKIHGASDFGDELRDLNAKTCITAGLPEVAEKDQVGDFRELKEMIGHHVNGEVHSLFFPSFDGKNMWKSTRSQEIIKDYLLDKRSLFDRYS